MLQLLLQVGYVPQSVAKPLIGIGKLYNVQDFIDDAPGTGANKTTLGIQRCLTTVANAMYSDQSMSTSYYTIVFPKAVYSINDKLAPFFVKGQGLNTYISHNFDRNPTTNTIPRVLNIIGLDVDNAAFKNVFSNDTHPLSANVYQTTVPNFNPLIPSDQWYWVSWNSSLCGVAAASILPYINAHISKTNIQCNDDPASINFLSCNEISNTSVFNGPLIKSLQTEAHCFFILRSFTAPAALGLYPNMLNIAGIHLRGNANTTNTHIYNSTSYQHNMSFKGGFGMQIGNFKEVYVDNNIVENIYGDGITVNNKDRVFMNKLDGVNVSSNIVKNVWKLKYKLLNNSYDDGGDGIYFEGIISGKADSNYIVNDVAITKQYGRLALGACSERTKNCSAKRNYLQGYDRNFHIENDHGGHAIIKNRMVGSETGIVIDSYIGGDMMNPCPYPNPSEITSNYISNEQLPNSSVAPNLRKLYPPRLFFTSGGFISRQHDNTKVEENYFLLDKNNIRIYDTTSTYWVYSDPNTLSRYHMYSSLRRQKINCNVFKTLNPNLYTYNDGLFLMSNHANNNDPNNNNNQCMVGTNDFNYLGTGSNNPTNNNNTLPVEITGNILVNISYLWLNGNVSSTSTVHHNIITNPAALISSTPSVGYYTNTSGLAPDCNYGQWVWNTPNFQTMTYEGGNSNEILFKFRKNNFDEFEDILVYPNPASSYIYISNYHNIGTFELYNSFGQRVLSQQLNEGHIQKVFLPKLSVGSYSYKIVGKIKTHFGKLNILQNE